MNFQKIKKRLLVFTLFWSAGWFSPPPLLLSNIQKPRPIRVKVANPIIIYSIVFRCNTSFAGDLLIWQIIMDHTSTSDAGCDVVSCHRIVHINPQVPRCSNLDWLDLVALLRSNMNIFYPVYLYWIMCLYRIFNCIMIYSSFNPISQGGKLLTANTTPKSIAPELKKMTFIDSF